MCHGDQEGRGSTSGTPPHNETGHTWHHPDAQLKDWILNGKITGAMPPFKDALTKDEVDTILPTSRVGGPLISLRARPISHEGTRRHWTISLDHAGRSKSYTLGAPKGVFTKVLKVYPSPDSSPPECSGRDRAVTAPSDNQLLVAMMLVKTPEGRNCTSVQLSDYF